MNKALVVVIALAFSALSHAQVKVAVDQAYVNLAPYIVDDFKKAYELIGEEAQIDVMPGARALAVTANGSYQAIDARFKNTAAVENLIAIDVPIYLLSTTYVFGLQGQGTSEAELKKMKLVGSRASALNQDLKAQGWNINLVDGEATALKMVLTGRADGAILSDFLFGQYKAAGATGDLAPISAAVSSEWMYHHVHKSRADLVPKLEQAIQSLKDQGLFILR